MGKDNKTYLTHSSELHNGVGRAIWRNADDSVSDRFSLVGCERSTEAKLFVSIFHE